MASEKEFQEYFVKTLNVSYRTNVKVTGGYIDVLTDDTIYEVKINKPIHNIKSAVGQLVLYSKDYPDHQLCLVTPFKIKKYVENLLKQNNINSLVVPYEFEKDDERNVGARHFKNIIIEDGFIDIIRNGWLDDDGPGEVCLTDREEYVLRLYFGIGQEYVYSLGAISEKLKLTRERTRQIIMKALMRLCWQCRRDRMFSREMNEILESEKVFLQDCRKVGKYFRSGIVNKSL
ncbi:MAG: sigma factor-like helix-turn-helix DNA-binding protein [Acidobacteriia bacterium]|nr:sigma factor-like helix-turn-helix DNA-binding protein [Terriglobia bacterium]